MPGTGGTVHAAGVNSYAPISGDVRLRGSAVISIRTPTGAPWLSTEALIGRRFPVGTSVNTGFEAIELISSPEAACQLASEACAVV